jgi:nucleoid-associated protein YgaU
MKQFSRTICSVVTFGAMAALVGCQNGATTKSDAGGIRNDVTDIHPIEPAMPAAYQPPLYDTSATIPVAPQPMMTETPAVSTAPVTLAMATGSTTAGTTHIVRHGETLFSIAKTAYGNGKAWHKIAAANPGVSASKLRVGQKLIVP